MTLPKCGSGRDVAFLDARLSKVEARSGVARALTLLGATAAQVPAIDAVYTNFRDREGLVAEAAEAPRDASDRARCHY